MDARKKLTGATVALHDCTPPDIAKVVHFLNRSFVDLLGVVSAVPQPGVKPSGRHLLEFDDGQVALTMCEAGTPWLELETPCQTAWWWPEAETALRTHPAKIKVQLLGTRLDPLDAALAATAFTAAVAASTNAAGVLWDEGWVVQSPDRFIQAALEIPSGYLPAECWVHLGLSVDDGKTTVMTTGMEGFRLPDIEAVDVAFAPQLVVGRIVSFIGYLLRHGSTVKDGHSIGYSDQEQIRVRCCRSAFRPERDVFRLEFKKLLVPV